MYYKAYIIMIIVRLRISQYLLRLNYVNYSLGTSAVLLNEGMVMQHLHKFPIAHVKAWSFCCNTNVKSPQI